MTARIRGALHRLNRHTSALLVALVLLAARSGAQTPPVAHHAGAWTAADPWPGRSFSNSVWAVHMALTRGDTLFARPHSRVLAWGAWYGTNTDGGLWAWNPTTDVPASAGSNLSAESVARPPLQPFCAGHAALPNGDLLILGGTERDIAGEKLSARFRHQDRTWTSAPLTAPRWYGNATAAGRSWTPTRRATSS